MQYHHFTVHPMDKLSVFKVRLDEISTDPLELILIATSKYNRTIHSTVGIRPIDIIQAMPEDLKVSMHSRIVAKQKSDLNYHNRNAVTRTYMPGDKVYVKTNKRLGNKFSKLFSEKIVQKDLGTKLMIDERIVLKDNM